MEIDKVKCFHKYINLIYCNTKTIRNDEYIKILADLYTFSKRNFCISFNCKSLSHCRTRQLLIINFINFRQKYFVIWFQKGFNFSFLSNLKIYYLFIYLFFFYSKHNQQADINVTQKQENSKPDSNI